MDATSWWIQRKDQNARACHWPRITEIARCLLAGRLSRCLSDPHTVRFSFLRLSFPFRWDLDMIMALLVDMLISQSTTLEGVDYSHCMCFFPHHAKSKLITCSVLSVLIGYTTAVTVIS